MNSNGVIGKETSGGHTKTMARSKTRLNAGETTAHTAAETRGTARLSLFVACALALSMVALPGQAGCSSGNGSADGNSGSGASSSSATSGSGSSGSGSSGNGGASGADNPASGSSRGSLAAFTLTTYPYSDYGFSIGFPTQPIITTQSETLDSGEQIPQKVYQSLIEDSSPYAGLYQISAFTLPPEVIDPATMNQLARTLAEKEVDGIATNTGGTISARESEGTVHGYPAASATIVNPNLLGLSANQEVRCKCVVVNSTVYLMVTMLDKGAPASATNEFFDSFALLS